MNFHKTIGFLASLLLMVGIGVPDSFAQSITISVPTAQRTQSEDAGAVTVTVTVNITGSIAITDADATATLVGTNADPTDTTIPGGAVSGSGTITLNANGAGSGTIEWTPTLAPDADAVDDRIVLTVTAPIGTASAEVTSNSVIITITDTAADLADTAVDASGFRVTMAAPGPGKWAKVGKNQVKVQLHRRAGVASDFGNYTSIRVDLFDENIGHDSDNERETGTAALYSLSVADNAELSRLALASVKTDTLATVTGTGVGTPDATTNIVAYKRRTRTGKYDMLEFRFNIPDPEAGGTPARGPENLMKTYAVVTFASTSITAGTNDAIESRDTETTIFPSNPSAFSDKVGDGKLVMIDRDPPLPSVINSMNVNITDDNDNNMGAGIGDKIELRATIDGVFRDHSVVFQIITPEAATVDETPADDTDALTNVINPNGALVGFSKTFSASDIFDTGNLLSHEFTVTANQFKRKYTANDPINDPRKYNKNDTREDDQMSVRARAQVKDQAGNSTNQYAGSETALNVPPTTTDTESSTDGLSARFILDSKPPKVKIVYPKPSAPDSNRFTAKETQEYEFIGEGGQTVDLNPLKFSVDEDMSASYVVIDGNHATRSDTLDLDITLLVEDDDGNLPVDLSNVHATKAGTHTHRVYKRPDNGNNEAKEAAIEGFYNKGTKTAKLTVAAYDESGNLGKATPDGGDPIFDNLPAKLTKLFPNTDDLEPYDNKIGGPEGTQHPVFRLNEAVDSILARYEGGGNILEVAGTDAQNKIVDNNIRVRFMGDNELQDGEIYDLQVYVRDLAGHVTLSGRQDGLTFEENLSNPAAGAFKLATNVHSWDTSADPAAIGFVKMDSVVANQGMRLTITALDAALSESAGEDRRAITYAKAGVKVVIMDSDGNPESSAKFWGGASGNGTATLNDLGWSGGERNIFFQVTKAGSYTIAVKDMNDDGTVNFMKTTDIVVDAADFQKFVITAWEDGQEVSTVWDEFDLVVTPTDRYNNASLKTFNDFVAGKVVPSAAKDSLDILDSRVGKNNKPPVINAMNTTKKYSHVDVNFASSLIEDLPFSWSVRQAGDTFSVRTLQGRTRGSARVRAIVDNDFLLDTDNSSRNKSGDATFTIGEPLDISITLWVPGMDGDQAGETVTIPAGGSVDVTARAEGLNEGDTVTFDVDGTETEATADADGYAGQPITLSGSGTVSVTASVGQYSASLDIVHEEQAGRVRYVDADGNDVYIVTTAVDMEVGADDVIAAANAFGTSEGEDGFIAQADIDGDGEITLDDLLAIASHWGRVATGPATKPIVLAPGVNQDAEFALNLGSERVVAGELVAVDVSLANVAALMGYGFTLNYDATKFEFISVAPADENLLTSTGGEIPLFHHVAGDGQVEVATGMVNGSAVSGGGDIVQFVFRVLYEFEDNARFEIANGLVFDPSQLQNPAVVAGVLELQSTPREFALHQNFPNPFNPDTTIKYDLAESADVTLQIYNVLGQVVRTLVASEAQNAGRYQIRWNGMDERGVPVSSGIYFYQISADGKFSDVRKLMLLK